MSEIQDAIALLHREGYVVRKSRGRYSAKGRPLPGLGPEMARLGWKDEDVARESGYSVVWVRTLKNDASKRATENCAQDLAQVLGVDVHQLYVNTLATLTTDTAGGAR